MFNKRLQEKNEELKKENEELRYKVKYLKEEIQDLKKEVQENWGKTLYTNSSGFSVCRKETASCDPDCCNIIGDSKTSCPKCQRAMMACK